MSLVNQMLRDLEKNQSSTGQLPLQAVSSGYPPIKIIVWIIVLLTLAGSLYYFSQLAEASLQTKQAQDIASISAIANDKTNSSQIITQPQQAGENSVLNSKSNSALIASSALAESKQLEQPVPTQQQLNVTDVTDETDVPDPSAVIHTDDIINSSVTTSDVTTSSHTTSSLTTSSVVKNTMSEPDVKNYTIDKSASSKTNIALKTTEVAAAKTQTANLETTVLKADTEPKQAAATKNNQRVKQQSKQTQLNNRLQRIQLQAASRAPADTYNELKQLLKLKPDFHPARIALIHSMIEHSSPQTPQALAEARRLYPQQSSYLLTQAQYLIQRNQFAQLESELAQIDPADINYAQLLQLRAVAKQKQNKHQLAIQDYLNLIQISANKGSLFLALGLSFDALGQKQRAQLSYKKALNDQNIDLRQRQFLQAKIARYQQASQG